MLEQQFTVDPRFPGVTFGFLEIVHRGQRLLVRDGLGTRSRLVLFPSEGVGLFVHYTSDDDEVREEIVAKLLKTFFPASLSSDQVLHKSTLLAEFAGVCRPLQWDRTTPGKLALLFANQILVQRDKENPSLLRITSLGMGESFGGFAGASLWQEQEPFLFIQWFAVTV